MSCSNNESDFVKTVELDVSVDPVDRPQPQYRICVYRLASNPDRFVVRVIGSVETVEVAGSFGVVQTIGLS